MTLQLINRQPDGLVQFKGDHLRGFGFRAPIAGSAPAAALAVAFGRVDVFDTQRAKAEADPELTPQGRDARTADARKAAVDAVTKAKADVDRLIAGRKAALDALYAVPKPTSAAEVMLAVEIRQRFASVDMAVAHPLYAAMMNGDAQEVLIALAGDPVPGVLRERALEIWRHRVEEQHGPALEKLSARQEDEERAEIAIVVLAEVLGGISRTTITPKPDERKPDVPPTYWSPATAE